ncbi:MAG: DUF2934 domain-containing protein [Myxococcota bacterium]|nr:DUF2934 domain-containing protein [Myxococcota bacterium]
MAAKKTSTKKAGAVASTGSTKKLTKKPATKKATAKKASSTPATAGTEVKATKKAAAKKTTAKKAATKKAAPKKAAAKKAAPKKATATKASVVQTPEAVVAKPLAKAGVAPAAATQPKAAVRPKKVIRVISLGEVQEMVAREAYYIAERRHFQGGNQTKDWLDAEAVIYANLKQANIVVQR